MGKKSRKFTPANKHAIIASRIDRRGNLRTETQRRDDGTIAMAVSTNAVNNATKLYIDGITNDWSGNVSFDGRQARSLYRLLKKHYGFTGKSRKA